MLLAFSIAPSVPDPGGSYSRSVARAVRIVRDSGLPNHTDAMFTTLEGDWDECLAVVKACVDAGVRSVWFHRGVGPGSASPEAVARAEKAGMTVITDACPLMFLESGHWLHGAHRWGRGLAAPHAHGEPAR